MFANDHNPLLRRRRSRGAAFSAAAILGILTAGTIAVSAAQSPGPQHTQPEKTRVSQAENLRIASTRTVSARRQVRVIPLFNTPGNQTGK